MKCFIIAALSADGFIARDPSSLSTTWTSREDKKRFVEITKRAGVVIMGRTTWETFGGKSLKDRLNIIYSRNKPAELHTNADTKFTQKSPQELLAELESRGYSEVAICGGTQIYSMFMKSGLVDSLYLTIEPIVFGSGIKLFSEEINSNLKLVNLTKTDSGTLFLEYSIQK